MAGVNVNIGANATPLQQQFQAAQQSVTQSLAAIQASLTALGATSTQVSNQLVANQQRVNNSLNQGNTQNRNANTQLGGSFSYLSKRVIAAAAAYLTLKTAMAVVESTIRLRDEVDHLGSTFGITSERASAYKEGLKQVDLSMESFLGATTKVNSILAGNEEQLTKWGVATRDANGHLKDSESVLQAAVKAIGSYKDGSDRAAAAQKILGLSLDEANKFIVLFNSGIDVGAERAAHFGTTVSAAGVEAANGFKLAKNNIDSALDGLKSSLTDEFLPAITDGMNAVAQMIVDIGPAVKDVVEIVKEVLSNIADIARFVMENLKEAFDDNLSEAKTNVQEWAAAVQTAFDLVKIAVVAIVTSFKTFMAEVNYAAKAIGISIGYIIDVFKGLATLDPDAISRAGRTALQSLADEAATTAEKINKYAAQMTNAIANIMNRGNLTGDKPAPAPTAPLPWNTPGAGAPPAGSRRVSTETLRGAGSDASAALKAQTQLVKAELEAQLAILKENLEEQKAALDDALAHNEISYRDYYDKVGAMQKEALQKEMDIKKQEIQALQDLQAKATKESDKTQIQAQIVKLQGDLNVLKMKEGEIDRDNLRQLRQKAEEMNKMKIDLAAEVAKASGVTDVAAQFAQVEEQYRSMKERLTAEGDTQGLSLLEKLLGYKKAELQLQQFQEKFDLAQTQMQTKVTELDTLGKAQGLTDYTMQQRKLALYDQEIGKLIEIKEAQLELATATYGANSMQVAGIKQTIAELKNMKQPVAEVTKAIKEGMTTAFSTFFNDVMSGTKSLGEAFKDLVGNIVKAINQVVAEALAKKLMYAFEGGASGGGIAGWFGNMLGGGGGGGGSGGGGFLSSIFGSLFGARAMGGFVTGGQPYLVGENGPELFVPKTSGNVRSNRDTMTALNQAPAGPNFNVTITTPDPHAFKKTRQQWMADLSKSVQRANNRNN